MVDLRRFRRSSRRVNMSMRLYHRRSSATRDRLQVPNGLSLPCGRRDSLSIHRPRSQSLFPGSPDCLAVPARSRSLSFSGPSAGEPRTLTASEEEHIFRCYTRVMYVILGGLAAGVMGMVLYGVHSWSRIA